MYEIDWDTPPLHAVYDNFSEKNIIESYSPSERLETVIAIDWGYAHPMAVCFMQYDRVRDVFYQFDEILKSKLTLDMLYQLIEQKIKQHNLKNIKWFADIAGNQEREQIGMSNIKWFWEKHQIKINSSRLRVLKTIAIVRSYIENSNQVCRYYVTDNCAQTIDGLKRYRYVVKDGVVQNENPEKLDDDICDALRYGLANASKVVDQIQVFKR
jgi:phage terminase large subunit